MKKFREAEDWFLDERNDEIFSFVSICEQLGINPKYLRQGLLRWKQKKLAATPATVPRSTTSADPGEAEEIEGQNRSSKRDRMRWLCTFKRSETFRACPRSKVRGHGGKALAMLSPREEAVLRSRFGIGEDRQQTLEEIGKRYSITRERARQIEQRAIEKLRNHSRSTTSKGIRRTRAS